jgi:hypothetical protein
VKSARKVLQVLTALKAQLALTAPRVFRVKSVPQARVRFQPMPETQPR